MAYETVDPAAGTVDAQPRIIPSSHAKMKRAGAEAAPLVTVKPEVPLKTTPVGPPRTVTTRGSLPPVPVYGHENPFGAPNGDVRPSA
jgi:hypothetical protein